MGDPSKQYELLHDAHKVALHEVASYDDVSPHHGVVYSPSIKHQTPIDFHGEHPPVGPIMKKLNDVYGNPWNRRKTWQKDGYIEQSILPDSGKVSDGTVIFCMILSLIVLLGILYMSFRLLLNMWCRYRRGRPVQSDKGVHAWGKWAGRCIDTICLKMDGRQARHHWDRFRNRRMQYPV